MQKNNSGKSWFNTSEYHRQREEKEIFEVLKRSPEIDASDVRVYVEGQIVTLAGAAEDAEEARAMGKIVQNIPGVTKVIDHLYVRRGTKLQ